MSEEKTKLSWLKQSFRREAGENQLAVNVRRALMVFAALAVLYVLASLVMGRTLLSLSQNSALALDAHTMQEELLQMRRNEKDFFLRRDPVYLETHAKNFVATKESLERLIKNPQLSAEDKLFAEKSIVPQVESYRSNFEKSAKFRTAAGANFDSGRLGELRDVGIKLNKLIDPGNKDLALMAANLRTSGRDFIIREEPEFIAAVDDAAETFVHQAQATMGNSEQASQLVQAVQQYREILHRYAEDLATSNDYAIDARDNAHAIEGVLPGIMQTADKQREASSRLMFIVLTATAALIVAVLGGLAYLLVRTKTATDKTMQERLEAQQKAEDENETLNNSVINILQAVNQISQRDLTVKAPVTQDVIGTVSDSINALTDETAKVLHGVTDIAGQVEQVSTNVKSQADLVTQTAEDERQSVHQMVESLLDATQTMNQVAALAEQSNHSAEQATTATENALGTVTDTVKGMESIRETIAETEKRIKRLGERSQEISGIVNLINTISERTHVLALNASMQAAVAGEAGRGFAVVAEEVQRLAESSRNATQQISTLVNNIQLETNETINTVNRTIGQVVEGSEQAQKAGEQMRRTQEITSQLVAHVRSIANASEQQKSMSAQLLTAVQRIGESTENTARQIAAQNKETDTLLDASRKLVESVNVFKLPPQAA